LPNNSKNFLYADRKGENFRKSFLWDQDNYLIFFKEGRNIVINNITQDRTFYYSINKYYPNIKSIAFDLFTVPELVSNKENNYLFIRADLASFPGRHHSLFLAFDKDMELLYEELVDGLYN
jgi:hypothetical protein